MATYPYFIKEHAADDFQAIIAELQRKPLPVNYDRMVAGQGKSQAFGVIRRWSYRPWLSRNSWQRPELWSLLLDFAAKHVPIQWDAVQVNDNYRSAPHRDKGNRGESYIVGFGDYSGGALNIHDTPYDIRHRAYVFRGSEQLHWTEPWEGQRYSLVFFKIEWPAKFAPGYAIQSRVVEDGLEIHDAYDDSVMVLDRKGRVLRTIRQGQPRPWRGRVTSRGQPARVQLPTVPEQPGT